MKQYILIVISLLLTINLSSQKVTNGTISSAFVHAKTNTNFLTSNVGEASLVSTLKGNSHILTQGFLQIELKKSSSILTIDENTKISLYPNPTLDKINFSFSEFGKGAILIQLFDMKGAKLDMFNFQLQNGSSDEISLDLSSYASATYLCSVEFIDNPSKKYLLKVYKK